MDCRTYTVKRRIATAACVAVRRSIAPRSRFGAGVRRLIVALYSSSYPYDNSSYADTERRRGSTVRRTRIQHVVALRRFVVEVRRFIVRGYSSPYWYSGPSCAETERCRATAAWRRGTTSQRHGIQNAVALRQPIVCGYNTLYRYGQR